MKKIRLIICLLIFVTGLFVQMLVSVWSNAGVWSLPNLLLMAALMLFYSWWDYAFQNALDQWKEDAA